MAAVVAPPVKFRMRVGRPHFFYSLGFFFGVLVFVEVVSLIRVVITFSCPGVEALKDNFV